MLRRKDIEDLGAESTSTSCPSREFNDLTEFAKDCEKSARAPIFSLVKGSNFVQQFPTYQDIFFFLEGVLFFSNLTGWFCPLSDPKPAAIFRDPLKGQRYLQTDLPVQHSAVAVDFFTQF
jgi:hypothetical protein